MRGTRCEVFLVADVAHGELSLLGADFRAVTELETGLTLLRFGLVEIAAEFKVAIVDCERHVRVLEGDECSLGLSHHSSDDDRSFGLDVGDQMTASGENRTP